jgi:hypothetical protein
MTKLPKKQKKYIDIRLHLSSEVEEFDQEESYEHFTIDSAERIKFKGIDESELYGLSESVSQTDHYQIYLLPAINSALSVEGVHEL